MVVRFRKKVVKKRGSRTYGYGSSKKHRGKGSKGGKGLAGSGKKGQQKKVLLNMIGYRIGKRGFTTPYAGKSVSITTRQIIENPFKIAELFEGNVDEKKKVVSITLDKNVRVIMQRSLQEFNYKDYDITLKIEGKITEKAKEYLESYGIKIEM